MRWWQRKTRITPRATIVATVLLCALIAYIFALPRNIFQTPFSTVLEANNGNLLAASIAADGQWRFPQSDSVPQRFAEALITFEDKRFYHHPGADPLAMMRAAADNLRQRKIVSGGSTISMQVIRLARRSPSRTFFEKCVEIILATRLEWSYSKGDILALYASHAPFGGNVVGLDAACWRYFGRSPSTLSWAEAALLAVLPNSPSLIHPGRNRVLLKRKRDSLIDKLFRDGKIDSLTCELSKAELIPEQPQPLPRLARHLLDRMKKDGRTGTKLLSTIDHSLQQRVELKLQEHYDRLKAKQIYNGAILVLDVKSGGVLAYAGNVVSDEKGRGHEVDIIRAPRSTGSILKPLLYAASLDEGLILPHTLLPDIPIMMNGFSPKNFSEGYDGAVHASDALIRSLNVPSVFLLKDYRYEKFYTLLKNIGLTTLPHSADHYGLSLILGGAEGSLWDITGIYASMARSLNNYFEHPGSVRYVRADFHGPTYVRGGSPPGNTTREETSWLSAASIYTTFETLKDLYRPTEEAGWRYFNSSKKIAWKTGTSFGFRDGWAVGVNGKYAVGVWVGNADGEGKAGLTGTTAASPILFDIFSILPQGGWFSPPHSEMVKVVACRRSGQRVSAYCEETDTLLVAKRALETRACTYHKMIHLSSDGKFQVHSQCADVSNILHRKWFALPPVQEHYYREKNISYRPVPPFRVDCEGTRLMVAMDLVYPQPNARILIPRDFDGTAGHSVFELAHRDKDATAFWHLDGVYIGTTKGVHRLALNPVDGRHLLTIVDENGQSLEEYFTVISRL